MSGGTWFKVFRQFEESDIFQNSRTVHVFVWCLIRATYTTRHIRFHGECITLQPGQFISGRYAGARACYMHPSTFRNQIQYLCKCGALRQKSDNEKTIFTVVNWAHFQSEASGEDNGRTTEGHKQEGKKGRRRRTKEETPHDEQQDEQKQPSDMQTLITFFSQKYEEHRKSKYAVVRGRDHAAAKTLIDSLGLEEAQTRAVRYLTRHDKYCEEHGYTIHNLGQVINGLAGNNGHESEFEASQREAREMQRLRAQQEAVCQN